MRTVILAMTVVAIVAADAPRLKRASLQAAEKQIDGRLLRVIESPFLLLGQTRAMYVEGSGAMFSAEVNLFQGPTLSPFRQSISKDEIVKVRQVKLARLPKLRESLREALVATASSLDDVPSNERVAIGVTLLSLGYEDTSGMPGQIVVQGERGKLIAGKLKGDPNTAITVREY